MISYMKINFLNLLVSLALSLPLLAAESGDRPVRPNVVLLLADDLGWQDVKCYDVDAASPYETPHIDALASKGALFRQGYSPAPTCAPTRCAIMSGNHPARAQKTHVVGGAPPVSRSKTKVRVITPWYSGRMPAGEMTLARVLTNNGYATGHSGKWHMAINHNAFPQPMDQGFTWTRADLGVSRRMTPHRLTGFATDAADDKYRLDENGRPLDQTTEDALTFMREHQEQPFFLYYAAWLVHTPIHSRDRALLEHYCRKLGVEVPTDPEGWNLKGQRNPYYCAMVALLDYYMGRIITHLETTDDPRWPGHKLIENTYVFMTSDNGGMEQHPGEIITDNYPLDRGKISAREGGTRVPFIVAGPGIQAGVESDVMVNGLDFYPTILSLAGLAPPPGKSLDGCDLAPLLKEDPADASLVKRADGQVRDSMVWHFPHSVAMESTIREGDYKLIRKFDHINNPAVKSELELFRLYDSSGDAQRRVDIQEAHNLAGKMPALAKRLNNKLSASLREMDASMPYLNPDYTAPLPNKEKVCVVLSHQLKGQVAHFTYQERGAKVVQADLIYTDNGGARYEEWYRVPLALEGPGKVSAELPEGTTHYYLNLVDEHRFLRSHPDVAKNGDSYTAGALATSKATPLAVPRAAAKPQKPAKKGDLNVPFTRWDSNKDDFLSLDEYTAGLPGQERLKERWTNFDRNDDGKVSRDEFVNR